MNKGRIRIVPSVLCNGNNKKCDFFEPLESTEDWLKNNPDKKPSEMPCRYLSYGRCNSIDNYQSKKCWRCKNAKIRYLEQGELIIKCKDESLYLKYGLPFEDGYNCPEADLIKDLWSKENE